MLSKHQNETNFREIHKKESKQNKGIKQDKKSEQKELTELSRVDYLNKKYDYDFEYVTEDEVRVGNIYITFDKNDRYLSDFQLNNLKDAKNEMMDNKKLHHSIISGR